MFIFLTKWNRYGPSERVLINPDNITYAYEQVMKTPARPQYQEPGSINYAPAVEAATYNLTIISFAAGLQEESDSIYVLETLDQIYNGVS